MRWRRQTTTFLPCSSSSSEASSMKGLYFSMALPRKAASRQQMRRKASYRSCEKQSLMLPSNSMSRSPSFLELSMVGTYLHRNSQRRLMRSLCMSIGSALVRLRRVLREQSESSVESLYFYCEMQSPSCLSNLSKQCSRMSSSFLAILEWLRPEVPLSSNRKISSKQRMILSLNSCSPIRPTSSSIRLQLNSSKAGMQPTQWQRVSRQRRIRRQRSLPSSCKHRQRYFRILRMSLSSVSLKLCASADETSPSAAPNPSLSSILSMVRLCSTFMGDVLSPSTSKLATNTPSNSLHSSRSMATRAWLQLSSSPCGSPSSRDLYMLVMTNSLREAWSCVSKVCHSPWILRVSVFCAQMRVWVWWAYAWMAEKDQKKREMWWVARRVKMWLRVLAISEVGVAAKEQSRTSTSLGHSTVPSLMRSNRHWTSSSKGRSIGALLFIIWLNSCSEAIRLCIYTCALYMLDSKITQESKKENVQGLLKEALPWNWVSVLLYNFKSDQQQPCPMQLVTRFSRLFATGTHKTWSQAQPIFKDYYSRRLTLAPKQLENFLLRLSTKRFSESDHRWLSLLQNIQGNLGKFQLQSRVGMLKALSTMGSKAELSGKLLQNVMGELKTLTFQETALLLWCLSKNSSPSRVEDATKVYQHICAILEKHEQDGHVSIVIRKEETNQFEGKTLALKSTSICMVLSAMAKLGISEKNILKHLLRGGVKPNLSAFSVNGLVSLLISLQKLGLRNKRDSLNIYLQIRKRAYQLQVGPLETIQNLVPTVASLAYSTHFEQIEVDGRQKTKETIEKLREIKVGIGKLVLWLCETVQLRQKNNISKQKSAKLLGSCGKVKAFDEAVWSNFLKVMCKDIQDCKIIDLVMSLKAITRLTDQQRKLVVKEEEQISTRLWALYSSITGKSLTVLALLHDAKKISPPPKMSAILAAHMVKLRTMAQKSRAEREGGEEEAEDQQVREKI